MPHDLAALRRLATRVALEAGDLLRAAGGPSAIETKRTAVDLVTDLDRQVERLVVERLQAERPHDAVLGEESGAREGTSGVRWLVDPIDGTTNFVYGLPGYAVSIGAEVEGERAVGVIHDVALGETFAAHRGGGATLDGAPIRVRDASGLASSLIGTGFSYDSGTRAQQSEVLRHVLPAVRDIRRRGAASLDLAWVACGRLDGFYEWDLGGLWDVGAGEVIVREAGGLVGSLEGVASALELPAVVIAAHPAIFEPLRALLLEAGARWPR
ncbi:MAG: inositol monophosphatase family protein [Dehalococcoidia bacterium]